jgi:hypothetical protein
MAVSSIAVMGIVGGTIVKRQDLRQHLLGTQIDLLVIERHNIVALDLQRDPLSVVAAELDLHAGLRAASYDILGNDLHVVVLRSAKQHWTMRLVPSTVVVSDERPRPRGPDRFQS